MRVQMRRMQQRRGCVGIWAAHSPFPFVPARGEYCAPIGSAIENGSSAERHQRHYLGASNTAPRRPAFPCEVSSGIAGRLRLHSAVLPTR